MLKSIIFPSGGIVKTAGNQFEGYAIRWHDANRPDLQGEWFSPKTYTMRDAGYPVVGAPTNYQHGLNDSFGNLSIGIIRFANEDDIGVFVQGELHTRERYIEMLKEIGRKTSIAFTDSQLAQKSNIMAKAVEELTATVPMQFSGGFDPSTWIVDKTTKHIDQCGLIHLAFTPTPADDLNPQVRFKSALDEFWRYEPAFYSLPSIQTAQTLDTPKDARGHTVASPVTGVTVEQPISTNIHTVKGNIKMGDFEKILALVKELEAAMTAYGQAGGASESEAAAMASPEELGAAMQAEIPEEELMKMKPEELAEKAMAIIDAKLAKRANDAKAAKAVIDAAIEARKRAAPVTPAGGYSHPANNPLGNHDVTANKGRMDIQTYTPFNQWDARDFSFAIDMMGLQRGQRKSLIPAGLVNQQFAREFADKAEKAFKAGQIYLSPQAFKSVMAIKADELNYSTQDGFGDQFVPTVWSDDIWERPRLDNVVQNLFETIPMPSNPYEYPIESTDPTVYFVAETTGDAQLSLDSATRPIPGSKVGSSKITFSAKKFALQVEWSSELQEDALTRLVPQYRQQAERAIQNTIDNVALNGDTSTTGNINADGETITATTRAYLAYDGLIHQGLVTATSNRLDAAGALPTLSMLRAARGLLGAAEGYKPNDLALITDYATYMKLLSDDAVLTIDKYGSQATAVTGELGRLDGVPIFVSAEMALADADGKITQAGNTVNRGRMVLVHRPTWKFAYRRQITQSLDFIPYFDMHILTITLRNHFLPRTATNGSLQSTDNSVAVVYNIGV